MHRHCLHLQGLLLLWLGLGVCWPWRHLGLPHRLTQPWYRLLHLYVCLWMRHLGLVCPLLGCR